ncbi:MAG: 6-carboxytetrahydropterin synthase QueD [Anaeroplasmataceae bacterium]|nr:6-carboxytetrahydropterin synthase QueD [Anaeroplasmataceae bacterium]
MYSVTCESSFDAAHFLSNYKGKCHNIHGHRWKVIVCIKGELDNGMVVDFGIVKAYLKELCDFFDHSFIVEKGSLNKETLNLLKEEFLIREVDFRTTAENFSKYFFDKVNDKYKCLYAEVYETPTNCARYICE